MIWAIIAGVLSIIGIGAVALVVIDNDNELEPHRSGSKYDYNQREHSEKMHVIVLSRDELVHLVTLISKATFSTTPEESRYWKGMKDHILDQLRSK